MRVLAPVTTFDGTLRLEMKKARLLHCHPFCLHIFIYGLQGKHPLRLTEFDDKIALVNDRKTSATSLEPKAVRYSQWIQNHGKINCHGTRPREQLRQSISTFRKHPLCVRDYQRQRFQMIAVHPETALALQKSLKRLKIQTKSQLPWKMICRTRKNFRKKIFKKYWRWYSRRRSSLKSQTLCLYNKRVTVWKWKYIACQNIGDAIATHLISWITTQETSKTGIS